MAADLLETKEARLRRAARSDGVGVCDEGCCAVKRSMEDESDGDVSLSVQLVKAFIIRDGMCGSQAYPSIADIVSDFKEYGSSSDLGTTPPNTPVV